MMYTLANGKRVVLKALLPKELECLIGPCSVVPTTAMQAKQIYHRNRALWRAAKAGVKHRGTVGCPHCQEKAFGVISLCHRCAWAGYERPDGGLLPRNRCLGVPFGGVCASAVCRAAIYGAHSELFAPFLHNAANVMTITQGHMDWSLAVIALDGVE